MANLLAIAELAARNVYPNPTPSQIAIFIEEARIQYAAAMWVYSKEEEATNGFFEIPSSLLITEYLDVKNNEIDISGLNYLNSLSGDQWLQNVGGIECDYVKSSLNLEIILRDDDSIGDKRTYYVEGKKIKFPRGTHGDKIPITYANTGIGVDPKHIECNEYVGSKVRDKLMQLFGKPMPEDKTINNSINN